MRIGKKILIFIFGFCIPAVMVVACGLSARFEQRIDSLVERSVARELDNISLEFTQSLSRLSILNRLYATTIAALDAQALTLFGQEWQQQTSPLHLQFYLLNGDSLTALLSTPIANSPAPPEFNLMAAQIRASDKEQLQGAMLLHDQAYMVSAVKVKANHYVVLVHQLDTATLNEYGKKALVSQIEMLGGIANYPDDIKQHSQIAGVAIPSLFSDFPLHLKVHFNTGLYHQAAFKLDAISAAILLLGLLIVALGYAWLRGGLLRPFKHLMRQLANIEASAPSYLPVQGRGCQELQVLGESINSLLARIFEQKEYWRITLESVTEAVIVTDQTATIIYLNPLAETLLGIKSEVALGKRLGSLLPEGESIDGELFSLMHDGSSQPLKNHIRLSLPKPRIMERSMSNLKDHAEQVIGTVLVLRDITDEELLKRQLRRQAHYDPVTGLANRIYFDDRLATLGKSAATIAVCYLDLEQFKLINDSCGHSAGDRMLVMVAKAMQARLGKDTCLARLGGDEFGLMICNHSALAVAKLLKKLIEQVSKQSIVINNCHYKVGLSIGVAFGRAPKINAKELLKDADIACIAAKAKGANQIHFYDEKDKELTYQRNAPKWAVRIAQAIDDNELILYYQPIRGLTDSSQRQRMEILLRIQEPNGRILAPAQFIAAAERFKLMPDIDKEVIRKAFLWLSLHPTLWDDHCISINLSGNSLGAEGMVEYIAQQQHIFDIPSQCICFEITETTAIQNRNRGMEMLKQLRKLGFSFALDDFGSGFASYGYLRELPVDYVKIDGCFVKNLAVNAKDYAIVKSIHDVCQVMGIETVAEFVENQDIIDKLNTIGINYAQGYAIGRPQPLANYRQYYDVNMAI